MSVDLTAVQEDSDSMSAQSKSTGSTGVQVSDNIAEDIIEYSRSNIIRNEQQSYLLLSGWLTGWLDDESKYVNTVVIGSAAGGKTHAVRLMGELIPDHQKYTISKTTNAGIYNDAERWNEKNCAIFTEWQKLSTEVKETLKELVGDDGGSTRQKSVKDEEGDEFEADEQSLAPRPFSMTYAEFGMDDQIWSRLFKNYIAEGRKINEAVSRRHAGHENITMDGAFDREYIYERPELERELTTHISSIPTDIRTHMPEWCYYAYNDMLDLNRSQSKRFSAMIPNLMHSATAQNHHSVMTTTIDDMTQHVVQPQEVANVLSCRQTLIGTTHEIEPRKRALISAIRGVALGDDGYVLIEDIQEYLEANNVEGVSRMKKSAIEDLLDELEQNFVIRSQEKYDQDGNTGYTFTGMSQIGYPRISGFEQFTYNSDDPFMGVDDPTDPFKDCMDPFKGIPFKESVQRMRDEEGSTVNTGSAAGAMGGGSGNGSGGGNGSSSGSSPSEGGQSTFGTTTVELDGDVQYAIYDRLQDVTDGNEYDISDGLTHEELLKLDGMGNTQSEVAGTLFDPEHDIWQYDDGSKRVHNVDEAKAKVEQGFGELEETGAFSVERIDESTVVCTVHEVDGR